MFVELAALLSSWFSTLSFNFLQLRRTMLPDAPLGFFVVTVDFQPSDDVDEADIVTSNEIP